MKHMFVILLLFFIFLSGCEIKKEKISYRFTMIESIKFINLIDFGATPIHFKIYNNTGYIFQDKKTKIKYLYWTPGAGVRGGVMCRYWE